MREVWIRNARPFLPLHLSVIPFPHPCSKELFIRLKVKNGRLFYGHLQHVGQQRPFLLSLSVLNSFTPYIFSLPVFILFFSIFNSVSFLYLQKKKIIIINPFHLFCPDVSILLHSYTLGKRCTILFMTNSPLRSHYIFAHE